MFHSLVSSDLELEEAWAVNKNREALKLCLITRRPKRAKDGLIYGTVPSALPSSSSSFSCFLPPGTDLEKNTRDPIPINALQKLKLLIKSKV